MNQRTSATGSSAGQEPRRNMEDTMLLADSCLLVLEQIQVLARRMLLDTRDIHATVPMLRGVWGAALHELNLDVYQAVFAGQGKSGARPPGYLLRPAPADPNYAPAVEWVLIGAAIAHDRVLCQAWDIACRRGLGPTRTPFRISDTVVLRSSGAATDSGRPWRLAAGARAFRGLADQPCRLVFPAPLRLRRHGHLIERPTLPDIVVAAGRRIAAFVPDDYRGFWRALTGQLLDLSRGVPAGTWQGERCDLVRYSGSQSRELELHGVTGSLQLPTGAGAFWPLLAAATWLHLGKGTVMGLGQLVIEEQ